MSGTVPDYVSLPGGIQMPVLGLGTFMSSPTDARLAVETALDCGYRHIDTAYFYQNEAAIGEVLASRFANGSLKREDIFVTTKLLTIFTRSRDDVRTGFFESLNNLKLDYVDLYLIHSTLGFKLREDKAIIPKDKDGNLEIESHDMVQVWKALEELVDEGKIRAIGVSNFNSKQIAKVHEVARHPIATNQVECHIYFQQDQLLQFCKQRDIVITAYAPLGSPANRTEVAGLLRDSVVKSIADKHKKTIAQVLLRWSIQRGTPVIRVTRTRHPV